MSKDKNNRDNKDNKNMKIKLLKSIKLGDKEVIEIDLDLENITGNDLIAAEESITNSGNVPIVTDFSRAFCVEIASRASGIPVPALKSLGVKDFNEVVNQVRRFLLNTD